MTIAIAAIAGATVGGVAIFMIERNVALRYVYLVMATLGVVVFYLTDRFLK